MDGSGRKTYFYDLGLKSKSKIMEQHLYRHDPLKKDRTP
jgi:hypothetical protein